MLTNNCPRAPLPPLPISKQAISMCVSETIWCTQQTIRFRCLVRNNVEQENRSTFQGSDASGSIPTEPHYGLRQCGGGVKEEAPGQVATAEEEEKEG